MRKHYKFIILLLVAVFILWLFGRNLDWQAVTASIGRAHLWYIVWAVLIICIGYLFRAVRWKVLLEPITESSLKELFATTTVGFAAIFLIGRAGEIVRPMWLPMRDKRVRPSAALVTLGRERIFDLASLVCFFAFNMLFFTPQPGRETEFKYVEIIGWLMLAAVVLGFVSLIVYQRHSFRVIEWFDRITKRKWIPARIQAIFISVLKQLSSALAILQDWRQMLWALCLGH